jgi:hypothetical protein
VKTIINNLFVFLLLVCGSSQCTNIPPMPVPDRAEGHRSIFSQQYDQPDYSGSSRFWGSNGDSIIFAAYGLTGSIIRLATSHLPNPLGISHVGMIVTESPRWVFDLIDELTASGQLARNAAYVTRTRIASEYGDDLRRVGGGDLPLRPFILEATGNAGDVLRGAFPCVQVSPLAPVVANYQGSVHARHLHSPVSLDYTRGFLTQYLGIPYEGLGTVLELWRATKGQNTTEETRRLFCSEAATIFYRGAFLRPATGIFGNASNALPANFSSLAGPHRDVLAGFAGQEILVKSYNNEQHRSCCVVY